MRRYPRLGAAVLLSAALGCGGGGAPESVCAGDRWGGTADMVDALAGCIRITGNLSITGNDLLNVELPLLTKVDGFLTVWGNPILTRATFATLETVGAYLDVSSNAALTSLGLPLLTNVNERAVTAAYDLVIRDNALPTCQTDAIRAQLMASGFRGTISISDNGGACAP